MEVDSQAKGETKMRIEEITQDGWKKLAEGYHIHEMWDAPDAEEVEEFIDDSEYQFEIEFTKETLESFSDGPEKWHDVSSWRDDVDGILVFRKVQMKRRDQRHGLIVVDLGECRAVIKVW